ncbi:MAG: hypothetical protein LBN20_04790 [Endomicrobium sp.]|jgi:acetyltransferase-like isoleucine patch superfamily enzyme|nr:hypothetical protein [Endomicrobium sp.]
MKKIVLWGIGRITEVIYYYMLKDGYSVEAFCIDRGFLKGQKEFKGKPVIAFEDIVVQYPPQDFVLGIPISYKNMNKYREDRYLKAKSLGYSFITYISSESICDASSIGENVFILTASIVLPFTTIGNNVIMFGGSIGHHCIIEDNCFMSGASISGNSIIQRNSFVSNGALVSSDVQVGGFCLIGPGAVVTHNVKDYSVLAVKQTPRAPIKSTDMEDILG